MSLTSDFQVVVLAGGKGVRMVSELPKVLHRLCGETLVSRVLVPACALGPKNAVVVVGFQAKLVESEVGRLVSSGRLPSSTKVQTVFQSEQKGTGHAVMMAESLLGQDLTSSVLILPGDAPLLSREDISLILQKHQESGSSLSVVTALVPDPAGFGRVIRNSSGHVTAVVEKKDCTPEQLPIREINSSLYVVQLGLLKQALKSLRPNNAQNEYYLTDIIAFAVAQGLAVNAILIEDYRKALGANDRAELSALESIRRKEIALNLMKGGVTLEDPERTYVDEGVEVGPDSFLGAGTRLQGTTKLGPLVRVDGDCIIKDCQVGKGVHVKLGCHLEGAEIGEGSFVGPFARLRQGTVLGKDVHVGNFLEAKNTHFHDGAKANHVSYLGDSEIGSRSNIGAGTIFCNYDGERKSKTIIGEAVFVGSNSTLVAPLEVKSNAYIAAGSVITEPVPSASLALGRSRQTIKEGWRKRGKEKE